MNDFVIGRPKLLNKDLFLKRVQDILDSSMWSNNGQYVQRLESYLEEYLGCKHVIAVSNAIIGLELCIKSLKNLLGPVCKVPSFTFVATASALRRSGIDIQFADILDDYCISPDDLSNTNVIAVNLFGNVCSPEVYKRAVLFDNAHALGVYNENKDCYVGADSYLSVFSLHGTKICGSGECGFITTTSKATATYLRELRNFGYDSNSGAREGNVIHEGTNAKVSEIQAAMALTQLENIQEIQEKYFENHQEYEKLLPDLVKPKNNLFSNYSYVVAEVEHRDRLIAQLNDAKIFPRTYFKPLHTMDAYKQNISLPNTERIASRILCLPTGLCVNIEDIRYICKEIRECLIQK